MLHEKHGLLPLHLIANSYTDIELEEIISKQPLDWMTSILKCQNQEKKYQGGDFTFTLQLNYEKLFSFKLHLTNNP